MAEIPTRSPESAALSVELKRRGFRFVGPTTAFALMEAVGMVENLISGDEGMIFQLANKFDIRHRDGKQFDDYGDEFMDWIFWIYLSTIELTNKVLERQSPGC